MLDERIFDVTGIEETHDPIGARIGDIRSSLGGLRRRDFNGTPPGPHDPSTIIQEAQDTATHDPVNHPVHYVSHPSGVECIIITEWMNFNLGNAVKYIWRANDKGATIQDLEKARWYLDREISRLGRLMATDAK